MDQLHAIRDRVPATIRSASSHALEQADPPAPLVRLFALDALAIAIPVLRSARLSEAEWIALLPELSPSARSVLRNRRDLGPAVRRALDSFGKTDFVLSDGTTGQSAPAHAAAPDAQEADYSFVALATGAIPPIARAAPVGTPPVAMLDPEAPPAPEVPGARARRATPPRLFPVPADPAPAPDFRPATGGETEGVFEIAEVVARIDAFWRQREANGPIAPPRPQVSDSFRFETDAKGIMRWVDGVSRAPLIGLSLDVEGVSTGTRVDAVATGAFRRRAGFAHARLVVEGDSDAAGDWLFSGVPAFDPANGRFIGYRGTARRPRTDERAAPIRDEPAASPAESLRQLVHELRTPTNAIAGFAEMIETQMLGPVSDRYRDHASVIREQARELLGAIDDLDLAARIDSAALALVPGVVPLRPLFAEIVNDLTPLSELRGATITLPTDQHSVVGDHRAIERLLSRLMATLVSASGAGETIGIRIAPDFDNQVAIRIDRPRALADYPVDSVLGIDDAQEDATVLGTGFALRLSRNLARELGGSLTIASDCLTLRLPAAAYVPMGQAQSH